MQQNKLQISEFLGWHTGDGCISTKGGRYQYSLTGDITEELTFYDKIVVPSFNKIFHSKLNEPVRLRSYKSVGVCGIYFSSKYFTNFLINEIGIASGKKTSIGIPSIIESSNEKRLFLRGLFDTDGSIYFCKSYSKRSNLAYNLFHYSPKIKLATISQKLIWQVHKILIELGFSPRIQKPRKQKATEYVVHSVVLDTKGDVRKWIEQIGFNNVKHSSKVEVWKRFGFCPPFTTLKQRVSILKNATSPLEFYPEMKNLEIEKIREIFL